MTRRVVVAGDVLLDVDLVGRASRLSPDAPVPVVDGVTEHLRPGGAALAACIAALRGADVTLVAPLADDEAAGRLRALLDGLVTVHAVPYEGSTPTKNRIRAGNQSIVRLDTGGEPARVGRLSDASVRAMSAADAVLVSDYGRGLAESPQFRDVLQRLLSHGPPVVWDPHPQGAQPVPGVHLVTPNANEAATWLGRCGLAEESAGDGWMTSMRQADLLLEAWRVGAVVVTLGGQGALLSYGQGAPLKLSAPDLKGSDSCGAGDAFAASAVSQLAAGEITVDAVRQAVNDATHFVADGGATGVAARLQVAKGPKENGERSAARLTGAYELAGRIRARGDVLVATGGCFDLLHSGHIACLQAARQLGDALIVCLNSDDSVRRLKGASRPIVPAEDRARVLQALECVDAVVVFDEDTPVDVLRRLRPHVWAKGGDYVGAELAEQPVVAEWGGHVVTVPYVSGRSTTVLVNAAAQSAGNGRSPDRSEGNGQPSVRPAGDGRPTVQRRSA